MKSNNSIADKLLSFGNEFLSELQGDTKTAEIESVLNILVTVWNASVVDQLENSNRCEKIIIENLCEGQGGNIADEITSLFTRKSVEFGDDLNIIANYWLTKNDDGSLILKCEIKNRS